MPLYHGTLPIIGMKHRSLDVAALRLRDVSRVTADVVTTFNPADKAANITLSSGDLRADGDGVGWGSARATQGRRIGDWYFEGVATSIVGGAATGIGVANEAATLAGTYIGVDTNGLTVFAMGGTFNGGGSAIATPAYVTGDRVGIAASLGSALVWIRINGVWQNGDPVARTGGFNIASMFGLNVYPSYSDANDGAFTMNFGATAFVDTIPSGFNPWNGIV